MVRLPKNNDPPWLTIAINEIGQKEVKGSKNNPKILEYHLATSLKASSDEVPWCSSFVNWCFRQIGIKGTGSAAARSWINWGQILTSPKCGCVVVFSRGDNNESGHVGFYIDTLPNGRINVLAGNQKDMVCIESFSTERLLGYRWPEVKL